MKIQARKKRINNTEVLKEKKKILGIPYLAKNLSNMSEIFTLNVNDQNIRIKRKSFR